MENKISESPLFKYIPLPNSEEEKVRISHFQRFMKEAQGSVIDQSLMKSHLNLVRAGEDQMCNLAAVIQLIHDRTQIARQWRALKEDGQTKDNYEKMIGYYNEKIKQYLSL
jgi:hypothetical protein